jgi:pimeloyl-ACP methyl ester carboxylesterase
VTGTLYAPAPRASSVLPALALAALGTAATALVVNNQARRAERRHPPLGRMIQAGGARLHMVEFGHGEGAPVVLLHGNGSMVEDFLTSPLPALLARERRVVLFDRPGCGHSERPRGQPWTPEKQAEVLITAFRQLGLERPIVLGHSWGTLVALAMALEHPEMVGGLVLTSGYYFPTPRTDVPLFGPTGIPLIGDVLRYTFSPLLGRLLAPKMVRKLFAPRQVPERFRAGFPLEMSLRPKQLRATGEDSLAMVPWAASAAPRYGKLRLPVAILNGEEDRIVDPARQAERLRDAIPGSTLELLPGIGHMLHHAAPERVTAAVRRVTTVLSLP